MVPFFVIRQGQIDLTGEKMSSLHVTRLFGRLFLRQTATGTPNSVCFESNEDGDTKMNPTSHQSILKIAVVHEEIVGFLPLVYWHS